MGQDSERSFLGRGWGFPPRFNLRDRGVKQVENEQDIRESLVILLSTSPGERVMRPEYGCPLNSMVFDTINDSTVAEIRDMIDRAVLFFEPRIFLESIEIDTSEQFEGKLEIGLHYRVKATNSRSNMVYPFYFREGTNLSLSG